MKKLYFAVTAVFILFLFSNHNLFAQLSGTYSIPGDYATISEAVTALNTVGVSGAVTFNVAAGHTETSSNITFTNTTPNAVNTVTFQKSGAGANPLITAGAGTSTTLDGIIKFGGTDYVTFDGIDVYDPPTNTTTTTKMEWGYAILKGSTTNASQNITIKNCVITINTHTTIYTSTRGIYTGNHLTTSTTSLTITAASGTVSNCSFFGNTINTAYIGIQLNGYNAPSPYTLYDQDNDIGIGGGNTINNHGGSSSTAYGIYAIYQNNIEVENNVITGGSHSTFNHTTTLYGIFLSTGINSNADISGNTVTLTDNVTSSSIYGINCAMGGTGTTNTININNNTLTGFTKNSVTSGSTYFIYNSSTCFNLNVYNNNVHTSTLGPGTTTNTGTIGGIYTFGTNSNAGSTRKIYNNTIEKINRVQSVLGSGATYCIYNSSSGLTLEIYNNTVNNNSLPSTGTVAGIYQTSTPTTLQIYNNNIDSLLRPNSSTGTTYGIYNSSSGTSADVDIYSNNITNLLGTSTGQILGIYSASSSTSMVDIYSNMLNGFENNGNAIFGIYSAAGLTINIYRNYQSNYLCYGAGGSAYCLCTGSSTAGSTTNVYNNYVCNIKSPDAVTFLSAGLYLFGSTANTHNYYYNTVYLDNVSTAATTFCGVYANTAPTLDLRNNIITNVSTSAGGTTIAYMRSSTTLTTYATTSNNNDFYAGTPGASNLIFFDGTNSDQTIADYKTRVTPRDGSSFTELPPFINIAATPYDLHLTSCGTSGCESGGQEIAGITTDYDSDNRYSNPGYPTCSTFTATNPDVGADEFGGNGVDMIAPSISYTALSGAPVTVSRSFTDVAVTDASGVNTTSGTRPRVYYKKSTDANTFAGNTFCDDGWKWVEANGSSTPFDFTIDYSKLYDALCVGGSVTAGDIIQYFVVAQDMATTPNVGINSGTFASTPSSVNLTVAAFPIGGTIRQYSILQSLSGTFNVGTGQTYTSLTGIGGLFEAINNAVVAGNITANITSDLTEDGTNALSSVTYDASGPYTIKIAPSSASEKLISGAVANGMIRFNGNDYVTIDGNNGLDGSGTKYLRFRNTDVSNPTFQFLNDSKYNTITNCYIEGSSTISAALNTAGVINFGTTTETDGNDSNTISDCDIRDRSDADGVPANLVACNGSTGTTSQYNDYITITGCNIYNFFLDAAGARNGGIMLWGGANNWTVTNNSFYQTATRTYTASAIIHPLWNNSSAHNNMTVTGNYVGGTEPLCGGTAMTMTSATAGINFYGMRLFVGGTTATSVQGNTIRNISFTTNLTASSSQTFSGIICSYTSGLVNIGNVTGNTIGAATGNSDIAVVINGSGAYTSNITGIYNLGYGSTQNNTIGAIDVSAAATITSLSTMVGIYHTGTAPASINITNNTIGSTTTANSIQNLTSTFGMDFTGIRITSGVTGTPTINNNTIQNITNSSTTTTSINRGIWFSGTATTGVTITNNTVKELSTASTNTAGLTGSSTGNAITGIMTSSSSTGHNVSGNTVTGIRSTTMDASATVVRGIAIMANAPASTMSQNKVYDLTNTSTAATPGIYGIYAYYGSYTCSNNMVTITNGEASDMINPSFPSIEAYNNKVNVNVPEVIKSREQINNTRIDRSSNVNKSNIDNENHVEIQISPVVTNNFNSPQTNSSDVNTPITAEIEQVPEEKPAQFKAHEFTPDASTNGVLIQGIHDEAGPSVWNYYYNTVYVGGSSVSGTNYSTCYSREIATTVVTMNNNLFVNARTGTGVHYAVRSTLTASWTANYNAFVVSDTSNVGYWSATAYTMDGWRTNSGGDKQSYAASTTVINPSNLLSSIGTGTLNIIAANTEAWLVSGKGIAITGQSNDFGGDSRVTSVSSGVTDIGADEFTITAGSNPSATEIGTIAGGNSTEYRLYGRTIARIDWGTGGSGYPSSLDVKYYSGDDPPSAAGLYGKSYWLFTPTGPLSGATYDINIYFGNNETYTIGTPATNTVLAKYNSSWEIFPLGASPWQTQLTYNTTTNTYITKVDYLDGFSSFALSDATSPLPVNITSFTAAVDRLRNVVLTWVTDHEMNNAGFDVERRLVHQSTGKNGDSYTSWAKVTFVPGHGNTNETHTYKVTDAKLNTGKYEYRLKQIDNNGMYEYYNLNNPSVVEIGKPFTADISQNYPNPSNPKCKIDYQLPYSAKVTIRVYDIIGQEVVTLVNELKQEGYYTAEFDGTNLASGMYFYRIIMEGSGEKFVATKKMVIVK